jgi:hypothetical protein
MKFIRRPLHQEKKAYSSSLIKTGKDGRRFRWRFSYSQLDLNPPIAEISGTTRDGDLPAKKSVFRSTPEFPFVTRVHRKAKRKEIYVRVSSLATTTYNFML